MKQNNMKCHSVYMLLFLLVTGNMNAQPMDIVIANDGILHYAGGAFASGVINNTNGGVFSIAEDYVHSETHFVFGPVTVEKTGPVAIAIGLYALSRTPVFTIDVSGATVDYELHAMPSGTIPATHHVLAEREIYTFTGQVSAVSANPASDTFLFPGTDDNGVPGYYGSAGIDEVFSTAESGPWTTTITAGTTTKMTFAAKRGVLGTDELDLTNFRVFPNPIDITTNTMNYNLPQGVEQLSISLYDLTGKQIQHFPNAPINAGVNNLVTPNVEQGMYLATFSMNNGANTTTKRIIIE